MTELKRCPFCGGEAYLQKGHDCIASAVRCKVCEGAVFGHRDEVAVERWNNRWMIPCEEGKTEGNWHTGTPTEEGWYLLHVRGTIPFRVAYMRNWQWLSTDDSRIRTDVVIEWQKIEENEDGRTD